MIAQVRRFLSSNPIYARALPFLVFLGFTMMQGAFGDASRFWVYAIKTFLGIGLIWVAYPLVTEARWKVSPLAIGVGIGVFILWVYLGKVVPDLGHLWAKISGKPAKVDPPWNPHVAFGENSAVAWCLILVRLLGSTFVVPPLEEAFYRSAVYRMLASANPMTWPLRQFHRVAFVLSAVVFGFAHNEWFAGILCGMAYQWLALRHDRLGEAMTAHAVTNFLLGLWVIFRPDWQFW